MFIAFDGPNGSGKTTLSKCLFEGLKKENRKAIYTKEPTAELINCDNIGPVELARLVALDRKRHCSYIKKNIDRGYIVISDRYILSSFILQGLDGLDFRTIDSLNNDVLIPDVYFVLNADAQMIRKRLLNRSALSRHERQYSSDNEIRYSEMGQAFLLKKGFTFCNINTEKPADETVKIILNKLSGKI